MIGALGLLKWPAIVVDRHGTVLDVNEDAYSLFDGDLSIKGKRLFAADLQSRMRLDRLVNEIRLASSKAGRTTLQTVVTRRQGRPVVVDAFVQGLEDEDVFPAVGALLLLTDLNETLQVSQNSVMEIFGLTPSQARLGSLLVEGKTLKEISLEMKISPGTARNHLKAVFLRTGTRRQAELVSLLSRLR
ncbi:LuxR C-terminal-related transcriptional regulator [Bradyrhizobium yuanmingense]|uniref:helix-turn-helix transcriptional regulator n=1 Tax=Bradyrhizobium yuanmingense TaxID=108015 RepID=UPI0021A89137|nr:LuxR C-terminal-related transcriptional regulator [Bradyrhizobium sp. CB1024]UWU83038.1 LuxR C-terminal-related transcriptional regulator [Bradyrhizobium sp. CB1024]